MRQKQIQSQEQTPTPYIREGRKISTRGVGRKVDGQFSRTNQKYQDTKLRRLTYPIMINIKSMYLCTCKIYVLTER